MKAIRVHQFGGPEVLKLDEVSDPKAGPGEVVVRLHAAGVNPADTYVRSGAYATKPPLPYTPYQNLISVHRTQEIEGIEGNPGKPRKPRNPWPACSAVQGSMVYGGVVQKCKKRAVMRDRMQLGSTAAHHWAGSNDARTFLACPALPHSYPPTPGKGREG